MRVKNRRDFWSGIMFMAFGIIFAVLAQRYRIGSTDRMGPGWFPTVLGTLLTILGLIITLRALSGGAAETKLKSVSWRGIILMLASVALFALLLPHLGMVVSIVVLLLVAALASDEFRIRESLGWTVILVIASYLIFVRALEIQFPVWPTLFGG